MQPEQQNDFYLGSGKVLHLFFFFTIGSILSKTTTLKEMSKESNFQTTAKINILKTSGEKKKGLLLIFIFLPLAFLFHCFYKEIRNSLQCSDVTEYFIFCPP